ncbi:MAG TPA: hypothetical protein VLY24_01705 [Bryobacteraceae bacterium]|nr:hypothetical protein [Bryobacteraceae bacterium]
MGPRATRPSSNRDLSPAERRFVAALQQLGFGHLESIKVRRGGLILDPWPAMVLVLKFTAAKNAPAAHPAEFELKKPMVELLEYIRGVEHGEIRRLEIRYGLPFSMAVEYRISRGMPDVKGEHVGAI